MTRELVFIHGRSQQHKDAVALKKEWLDALGEGLAKSNLTLPISDAQVRFPFTAIPCSTSVTARRPRRLPRSSCGGMRPMPRRSSSCFRCSTRSGGKVASPRNKWPRWRDKKSSKGPAQLAVGTRDPAGTDRFIPDSSAPTIALFTHDVYVYLTNPGIRQIIEDGIMQR